jgi:hypothetical protein
MKYTQPRPTETQDCRQRQIASNDETGGSEPCLG